METTLNCNFFVFSIDACANATNAKYIEIPPTLQTLAMSFYPMQCNSFIKYESSESSDSLYLRRSYYSIGKNCISYEKMESSSFVRLCHSLTLSLSPSLSLSTFYLASQCLNPALFHVVCSLLCECKFSAPKLNGRLE